MINLEDFNLDLDPEEVIKAGKVAEKDINKDEDTKRVSEFNENFKRPGQSTETTQYLD